LVGLSVIAFVLVVGGAVAQAQQLGKVARIGYLDDSITSRIADRLERLRQELSALGWNEGKNLTIESRFADGKMTVYLSLRRSWFVLRLI
jgi:Fe2+ transport system protein FeoA